MLCPTMGQRKPSVAPCLVSDAELRGRGRGEEEDIHKHWAAEMSRLNPDCWVWTPKPPLGLLPQHSGSQQEEEEEKEKKHPAACCYTRGCDDVISVTASAQWSTSDPLVISGFPSSSGLAGWGPGAQWSTSDPLIISGFPSSSGLAGWGPGAPSSQQPTTAMDTGGADTSQRFPGGRCWVGLGMETRGCVCVYGQREPEGLGPCWPGSPYVYYGVRRNLVVGVEVVEEVAVEDTLEVITDNIYTDDQLDPELLQDTQLFPT